MKFISGVTGNIEEVQAFKDEQFLSIMEEFGVKSTEFTDRVKTEIDLKAGVERLFIDEEETVEFAIFQEGSMYTAGLYRGHNCEKGGKSA
jgi:hypothetical protein